MAMGGILVLECLVFCGLTELQSGCQTQMSDRAVCEWQAVSRVQPGGEQLCSQQTAALGAEAHRGPCCCCRTWV